MATGRSEPAGPKVERVVPVKVTMPPACGERTALVAVVRDGVE